MADDEAQDQGPAATKGEEALDQHEGADAPPRVPGSDGTSEPWAVPPRAPLRPRSAIVAAVGALMTFLVMAADRYWEFSVPVGTLGCLVAASGLLDFLGTFDDPRPAASHADTRGFWARGIEFVAAVLSLGVSLRLAVAGLLPWPRLSAAVLVTASFLWVVVQGFRWGAALGAFKRELPWYQRHGFWLVAITTLVYLPLLGSFSLIDPWETHYGEVAREILTRGDWISFWWAQDGFFYSKPALTFWLQALSFSALGVGFSPDQMLSSVALGRMPGPEWAARFPVFLLALSGGYLLYKGTARVFGRLVGLVGGLLLITIPYWFLLARHTMTDMPYIAPLTAALGLLLYGWSVDPDEQAPTTELVLGRRVLRVSMAHAVLGAVLLCALPQVLYLVSLNLTWNIDGDPRFLFKPHQDLFFAGSGPYGELGNCGLPGNAPCKTHVPVLRHWFQQPAFLALVWAAVTSLFLWTNAGERRVQRLCFIGAWLCVALSALGKGAPGLVLPLFAVGATLFATRRWDLLARLEIGSFVLIFAVIVLPWYLQAFFRHGPPFLDRLLFHDMYKRAFLHVHDTNAGVDVSLRYYLWQLCYGLFPWTGLGAVGIWWWLREDPRQKIAEREGAVLLGLWFLGAFSMFTVSSTKFHHYIAPAVPPVAILGGVLLADFLDREQLPSPRRLPGYVGLVTGAVTLLLYGVLRTQAGTLSGWVGNGASQPNWALAGACLGFGAGLFVLAARIWGRPPAPVALSGTSPAIVSPYDRRLLCVIALTATVLVAVVGRDFLSTQGEAPGQANLLHLISYKYDRPWPSVLDFTPMLLTFTIVATVGSGLLMLDRWRTHGAAALLCLGVLWSTWGANVYMVQLGPHWGQRETVLEYYRRRAGPHEQLVAYQMNWKGENFYSSNRLPAFVAEPEEFKEFLARQREKGVAVMFFMAEPGRLKGLKSALGSSKKFEQVTDERLNNKFVLVRVEL